MQGSKSLVGGAVAAAVMCSLLNGCGGGGGGDDCQVTGPRAEVYFTPSVPVTGSVAQDALTYKLNQRNTWTLQPRGMTQACLQGLKVQLRNPEFPLPAGFTLDEKTGTIDSGVMTRPLEGDCNRKVDTTTYSGPRSVNRVCPSGYTLDDDSFVLVVTSDRYNQAERLPMAVIFQPAP